MAYLHCGHCGLEIKIRASLMAIQNCPRCLARSDAVVPLQLAGRPGTGKETPSIRPPIAGAAVGPDGAISAVAPTRALDGRPGQIPRSVLRKVLAREVERQRLVAAGTPGTSAPAPFEVGVRPDRRAVYLEPVGELDLASVPTLRTHAAELLESGFDQLVIDLRGLVFIDVAGVRLLLTLADHARRDGWRLSVIPGPSTVHRLFALTGTLDTLPFRPAVAARVDASEADPHATSATRQPLGSACWVG